MVVHQPWAFFFFKSVPTIAEYHELASLFNG